jgi:O-antigen/teichoic acid export membrane protein
MRSWLRSLRASARARNSLRNGLYGASEYVVMPATLLLATPFLLHRLGAPQFGLWMVANAAITSSGFLSTGFGDGALKYAATYRGSNEQDRLRQTLRVNLTINLVLGMVLAILMWSSAPAAVHLLSLAPALQRAGVTTFRIASIILLLRSVEGVFIGALRAHEQYGPAVMINVASRTATILCACILVANGRGVAAIMTATLVMAAISTVLQIMAAQTVVRNISLLPSMAKSAFFEVFHFGCFSWLQTLAGCIFSYADRLVIGFTLGASSVAYYTVCVQAAQPIYGVLSASLHFLFPHLSARLSVTPNNEVRSIVLSILSLNVMLAFLLCAPLALLSKPILHLWMGEAFAQQTWPVLSIVAVGFGFLALNITGHYALLALGQVRLVAILNLVGGVAMLAVVAMLAPRIGLVGAAIGRLLYGPITLLMYSRLRSMLLPTSTLPAALEQSIVAVER